MLTLLILCTLPVAALAILVWQIERSLPTLPSRNDDAVWW